MTEVGRPTTILRPQLIILEILQCLVVFRQPKGKKCLLLRSIFLCATDLVLCKGAKECLGTGVRSLAMDVGFLEVEIVVKNLDGLLNIVQCIMGPSFSQTVFNFGKMI